MRVGKRKTGDARSGAGYSVYWYPWGTAGWDQVTRLVDSTNAFARTHAPAWETERNTRTFIRDGLSIRDKRDASR